MLSKSELLPVAEIHSIIMTTNHYLCSFKVLTIALIISSFLTSFTFGLSIGSYTSSLSLTSSSTRNHENHIPHCAASPDWATPTEFNTQDCLAAIDRFYDFVSTQQSRSSLEFRIASTRAQTQLPQALLSHRFRFDTCSIGIAMLWDFRAPLPGDESSHPHGFPRNDVTTWANIYRAVDRVVKKCALNPGDDTGGWMTVNNAGGGIGVFVVQADSRVDGLVRDSV